jgi:uncharacterized protein (TIGR02600 family)
MKTRPPTHRSGGGFVLIIALGALAIMTILLLSLLRGASHQIRGAQSDAATAREKILADSAVALVIGQIGQASTQSGQAWISQPGLLRTYSATTTTRAPSACYKLYSAASLVDTGGTLAFLANDVPADWNSTANQNLYTDLNTPQETPGLFGQPIYPILDPAAVTSVEGLSIDAGHGVEMPVMWLYELQDGTLGPAANATKANPIVGRIAFWTDDDTCKIDINTAGCGSPWNTPRVNSTDDVAWSTTQPANGEFSRYPGHPAMTSLIPVFGQGTAPFSPQQLLGLTPRYAWGGSQFGAQATTAGEIVAPAINRLYSSLDELCFGTGLSAGGQRQPNPLTPAQVDQARFVLTAHSESSETTLSGEPRIAIWPVSDAATDDTRTTAADRAIASAATVGTRDYFFQRHNALSATADLDTTTTWGASNTQLFNDLVARGSRNIPGYGTSFAQKYSGPEWPQLMLEILDFMRGLNAVDPSAPPMVLDNAGNSSSAGFVPYAGLDPLTNAGRGFIVPLTMTDPATGAPLRGLGRCPTLSSLTLVIYVCGFGFADGTSIDYDMSPDDVAGTSWQKNFLPTSKQWKNVTSELLRAFVVPCTFHPGCGYPEVSDDCDIQITGLNGIQISSGPSQGNFGFPATVNCPLLGTPLQVLSADRAWGGNEGPIAWRATGDALLGTNPPAYPYYPFAGHPSLAFPVPFLSYPTYWPGPPGALSWPSPVITVTGATLTVLIRDSLHNPLQTFTINFPTFSLPMPTINGEADHLDGSTPATSSAAWATSAANKVWPSYYMSLKNRLLATQRSRPLMIQPGDVTRSLEAANDLRVIASLTTVPSTLFQLVTSIQNPGALQLHNFRFADGTSAYGASGTNGLVSSAGYPSTQITTTGTDYTTGLPGTLAVGWFTTPACSAPTGSTFVTMKPNVYGDWDTGPGFAPDGALINLPDAGTSLDPTAAYFSLTGGQVGATTRFAPNALVPSPVIFGSLPAGINPAQPASSEPWRTLLFCPYPAADAAHPGFASPPDHLVLDNFWMPVVEPYAIGTCMATAGKINLNDQIAPFTYLHRNTAFHALLDDLRIPAIPVNMANPYKTAGRPIASIWKLVDEDATIAQIESRFATGDAYLTESEVCTVPLVPQGQTAAGLDAFWNAPQAAGGLTGANLRELPYAQLYGRLTTRSNSYTVHVRVQVLQKLRGDPQQNVWKEGTDLVLGDWRGSYEIERYLDPAAPAPAAGQPLGPYRFRIVSSHRFAP